MNFERRRKAGLREKTAMCLCAVMMVGGVPARSQDMTTQPPAGSSFQMGLGFADQKISDEDLAQLVHAIAILVPVEHWRTFTTPPDQGAWEIKTLVDEVYDYFPSGDFRHPLTAAALAGTIRTFNPNLLDIDTGLAPKTPVRVPPFPPRASADTKPTYRVYNARLQASRSFGDPRKLVLDASPIAVDVSGSKPHIRAANANRIATYTIIVLPPDAKLALLSAATPLLPASVVPISVFPPSAGQPNKTTLTLGSTGIELLHHDEECVRTAAAAWEESDFHAEWDRLQRSLTASERETLEGRALANPLRLVDVDFEGNGLQHGMKVRLVVRAILKALGLQPLDQHVEEHDLCAVDEEGRRRITNAITNFVALEHPTDELIVQRAKQWVQDTPAGCQQRHFAIPDLVVTSVLWDQLRKPGVVNLSFRANGAIRTQLDRAVDQSSVIAIVAAGNEPAPLKAGWTLHDSSTMQDRVITVTHGDDSGVHGTVSDPKTSMRVWLAAPGCGFGVTDESGSSLAAPFVATALWLKQLLEAVRPSEPVSSNYRAALTVASRVGPTTDVIQSGGLFDMARFLSVPVQHIQFVDKRIVPLLRFQLVYGCEGELDDRRIVSGHLAATRLTVSPQKSIDGPANTSLWVRRVTQTSQALVIYDHADRACVLRSLDFDATLKDGSAVKMNLQQFAADIRSFTF